MSGYQYFDNLAFQSHAVQVIILARPKYMCLDFFSPWIPLCFFHSFDITLRIGDGNQKKIFLIDVFFFCVCSPHLFADNVLTFQCGEFTSEFLQFTKLCKLND